ncbi:hypothetical protein LTR17_005225 [Elasticomyces elasticus]|nr:hypothetical protein LTR17_005225 [Elasticomyces elasticus]
MASPQPRSEDNKLSVSKLIDMYESLNQVKGVTKGGNSKILKMLCARNAQGSFITRKPCRLLLPPAELRIRIYEFATVTGLKIEVVDSRKIKQPKLSATCHQIRRECLPVFYQVNIFCFAGMRPIPASIVDTCYVAGMRHIDLVQCAHNNSYQLDVNLEKKQFALRLVTHKFYDQNGESDGCIVNSDALIDGKELLKPLFQAEEVVFGAHELKRLCTVLCRTRHSTQSYLRKQEKALE